MPKVIAIVRPTVYLHKDAEGNTTKSDYHYPVAPNCHAECITWNKDAAPPSGDFLQEQMWTLEGPQESIDMFLADERVIQITKDECCDLGTCWDTPKDVPDRIVPGAKISCSGCGHELVCPDCGPMNGKTHTMTRSHRGWVAAEHAHHIDSCDDCLSGELDEKHPERVSDVHFQEMKTAARKIIISDSILSEAILDPGGPEE